MRPIENWLNELPEPIRSKALYSVDKTFDDYVFCKGETDSLVLALEYGFYFDDTKQCWDYWREITRQLNAGTPPSELVDPVHLDKSRQ